MLGITRCGAAFTAAALIAGCDFGDRVVTDTAFADSTSVAPVLDSALLAAEQPAFVDFTLPDSVQGFDMTAPVSVAIRPEGPCVVGIVDRSETAIHYFTVAGQYLGTISLAGRSHNPLSGLDQIGIAPDGTSYVWELGRRRIVAINWADRHIRLFRSDAITASMPPLGEVQPVAPNRLLENWMTTSIPVVSGSWAEEHLPLVRVIDTLGGYHGGLWRISDRPGQLLTHALNQGQLAMRGDTIWFAYFASGQIVRGVLNREAEPWRIRDTARISLPRLYPTEAPKWFRSASSDSVGTADVDMQIQSFSVTSDGYLVVAQTLSYPPPKDRTRVHIPSSAVVVYDHSGRFVRGWRTQGKVRDLAVGRGYLIVIVDPSSSARRHVREFRLSDLIRTSDTSAECEEES